MKTSIIPSHSIAFVLIALFPFVAINSTSAQEGRKQGHGDHHSGVNSRGDQVMGFDHDKTTHHFRLRANGGVIEVGANEPNDNASRDGIRTHLKHISQKFAAGDFTAPLLIHAQTPPGVPVMKELRAEIEYQFEQTDRGARVLITTANSKAVAAIHDFLRFQISDHKTGDSLEIEKPST